MVFTYKYISNPAVAATTSGIYKDVQSVEAINDYTVKINFRAPNVIHKDINPGNMATVVM